MRWEGRHAGSAPKLRISRHARESANPSGRYTETAKRENPGPLWVTGAFLCSVNHESGES
jgi:hypothetical protein